MRSAEAAAKLPARRRAAEREFLPAALEILETPASPVGRAVAVTIMLFFAAAIAWASFGKIDIIATAPGRIVPSGRTKLVQPFETGVVRAIHVRDGQQVAAGEVLIELDPTINAAERDRLARELLAATLDAARLKAALSSAADPVATFEPPPDAPSADVQTQRTFLVNQIEAHQAKLAGLDRQIAQNQANRDAVKATVEKLTVSLPLLKERAQARKYLAEREVGSRLQFLETQQDLVEHQQELLVQRARLAEAEASLASLREQRREADAEYRRGNLAEMTQTQQKAASLEEELIKARQHAALQTLTAPVDGTVQQLAVHTVGGVVTPAQALMVVVPADSRLEIEAMVSNRDIGFVHVGAAAEVKVDTFNFTRYGLLNGAVVGISQDAIARDKPPEKGDGAGAAASGSGDSSEPKGQELVYAARISLERTAMAIEGRAVNLGPGMAVTVEIRTGRRRVIEYLLSPLLRAKQAALRER
jgi:hemolysin D